MVKSSVWRLFLIVVAGSLAIQAQNTAGFVGVVTDATGAVVVGATITVTETATGLSRAVNSGAEGFYTVPSLRPTIYKITVEATGFKRITQEGITLQADQKATVNFGLQLGAVTEAVEVFGSAAQVNAVSGTISQVVDTARILELPLNGRNAAMLAYTVAGTVQAPTVGADQGYTKTFPGAVTISANGTRQNESNFYFDGGNNIDSFSYINAPFPFPDAVQEFSVQTSNFSAEYGMSGGALVSVTSKSGSNQIHGDAFEFIRNRAINARNYFASAVDPLKRHQYGGTIGGPVRLPHYNGRDKTFFFFGYQGTQIRSTTGGLSATFPTAANLQGDFSNVLTVNPNNPLGKVTTIKDPNNGQLFPGNLIPANRFDPASVNATKLNPVGVGSGLTFYSLPVSQNYNEQIVRIDHAFSDKDRLMGHFYRNYFTQAGTYSPTLAVTAGDGVNFVVQNDLIGETHVFSPTLLNDFRLGWHREVNHRVSPPGMPDVSDLGVNLWQPPQYKTIERLTVSGFSDIYGGGSNATYPRATWTLSDTMRWTKGRHSVAFGFRGDQLRMDELCEFYEFGYFTFTSYFTNYAMSDFMLGRMSTFQQGSGENRNVRNHWMGLFAQDDVRASRRLTFNFGLRWDPYFPWHDKYGRIDQFNPSGYAAGRVSQMFPNAPPGEYFPGDPGVPQNGVNPVYSNLAPRFGFAYDVFGDNKTVLRGGGGVFYDSSQSAFFNSRMVDATPWSPQLALTNPVGPFSNPQLGISQGIPQPPVFPPPKNTAFPQPVLVVSEAPDGTYRTPRVYNWNFTVEHQVAKDWLARVAYVGSRANHVFIAEELNPAVYTPGSTLSTDNRRPFKGFTNVSIADQAGLARFNGLEASLEKAFSHGLTLRANYTWSKSYDDLPFTWGAQGPMAAQSWTFPYYFPNADMMDRGPSLYDRRQRFVGTYVWQIPFPANAHRLLRYTLGGWQLTGLATFQSGSPMTILAGSDRSQTGLSNDRAVITGPAYGGSACTSAPCVNYLNVSSFSLPAIGGFGNAGKGVLTGPGLINLDAGFVKGVSVREHVNLQFRVEFFNITNRANFNNPTTSVSGAGFGTIRSAGDPRIGQAALKLTF